MATRGSVLVVEDSGELAGVLRDVLGDEGIAVTVAPTGRQGLSVLESARPDAVLLDHQLPDMDGTEFAARYRDTAGPHAPLILVTAAYRPEEIAAQIGANAAIAKPFDLSLLLTVLERYLPQN